MIDAWVIYVAIDCTKPRLPFREFYEAAMASTYPGVRGEEFHIVTKRIADGVASYVDYAEKYRDQCK